MSYWLNIINELRCTVILVKGIFQLKYIGEHNKLEASFDWANDELKSIFQQQSRLKS